MMMKRRGHKVRGVSAEQCRVLWWTITHTVIIPLLGSCQQPHAHSARLSSIHSFCLHSQASLSPSPRLCYTDIKILERETWTGHCWRSKRNSGCEYYRIYDTVYLNSHLVTSNSIGWKFIHTFFSTLGSFQLEAGVGRCHVDGADDPDSISYMPSIRSSLAREHTLRLDNEPVTSNTWKAQSCIWKKFFDHVANPCASFSIHWFIP